MPLLDVRHLCKSYGRKQVVRDVSFVVEPGEIVGLLGPNGAGKTTSFRMTMGLIAADNGQVFFDGVEVSSMPMYRRARLGMGYLCQDYSVFRKMTTRENLLAILETTGKRRSERLARAQQLLEEFGLLEQANQNAATLSGGQRRRLEIARCLTTNPSIILLDEPFTGIDPLRIAEIQRIVRGLAESRIAILLTDHHAYETLATTNRSYLIHDGEVILQGTMSEIVHDPRAQELYLGADFARRPTPPAPPTGPNPAAA